MKNKYRIEGNIVYIELHHSKLGTQETCIDLDDFDFVNGFQGRWLALKSRYNFYVKMEKGGKTLYLHRLLMSNPIDTPVYHVDGNTLNNRRNNLIVYHYYPIELDSLPIKLKEDNIMKELFEELKQDDVIVNRETGVIFLVMEKTGYQIDGVNSKNETELIHENDINNSYVKLNLKTSAFKAFNRSLELFNKFNKNSQLFKINNDGKIVLENGFFECDLKQAINELSQLKNMFI